MIEAEDFTFLAEMLRRRSGLVLDHNKPRFVEYRLEPVMRRFGFKTPAALLRELRHRPEALCAATVEAMTVCDTSFFRDRRTFEEFRDIVLPPLTARRAVEKTLRIWCAACATGQEAYSLAMILEAVGLRAAGWQIDIIATDLNSDAIARAQSGLYSLVEIQRGLPLKRLAEHFTIEGEQWRVNDSLRRMISFRPFNLMDGFGWLWEMDVVFCRNALMYFDQKTRSQVLEKIHDILAPQGSLMVGPAEIIAPPRGLFVSAGNAPGLYFKTDDFAARGTVANKRRA
jgi:chemotaxis protein methyltransferase CheR